MHGAWRMIVAIVALHGCGRIGFDLLTDETTDGGVVDVAADAPSLGPWPSPTMVDLGLAAVDDPSMTADGLELYVNTPAAEVFVAQRSSTSASWSPAVLVASLPTNLYSPHVSADGLTLWAVTTSPSHIIVFERSSRGAAWGAPTTIPEITDPAGDDAPFVTADGLTMTFDSRRFSLQTLYLSERSAVGTPWSAPILVSTKVVDVATFGGRPAVTEDRLSIYFQGDGTPPTNDIWVIRRSSPSAPFDPTPVAELNSASNEEDPWVSVDQRTALVVSNRSGTYQIWQSVR